MLIPSTKKAGLIFLGVVGFYFLFLWPAVEQLPDPPSSLNHTHPLSHHLSASATNHFYNSTGGRWLNPKGRTLVVSTRASYADTPYSNSFIHDEYNRLRKGQLAVDSNWKTIMSAYGEGKLVPDDVSQLPPLVIIGVQKGGTTSLFYYLNQHPQMLPHPAKEAQFWNHPERYHGVNHYVASFEEGVSSDLESVHQQIALRRVPMDAEGDPYADEILPACSDVPVLDEPPFPSSSSAPRPSSYELEEKLQPVKDAGLDLTYSDVYLRMEATPEYAYIPLVPYRVRATYGPNFPSPFKNLPVSPEDPRQGRDQHWPRFIMVMRDPVGRAYSACRFRFHEGCTPEVFDMGMRVETMRYDEYLEKYKDKVDSVYAHYLLKKMMGEPYPVPICPKSHLQSEIEKDKFYEKISYQAQAWWQEYWWAADILLRGLYSEQIKEWMKVYPREHFLFMDMWDLQYDLEDTMDEVHDWLGLDPFPIGIGETEPRNVVATPRPILNETVQWLGDWYARHNSDLETLIGRELSWNRN